MRNPGDQRLRLVVRSACVPGDGDVDILGKASPQSIRLGYRSPTLENGRFCITALRQQFQRAGNPIILLQKDLFDQGLRLPGPGRRPGSRQRRVVYSRAGSLIFQFFLVGKTDNGMGRV